MQTVTLSLIRPETAATPPAPPGDAAGDGRFAALVDAAPPAPAAPAPAGTPAAERQAADRPPDDPGPTPDAASEGPVSAGLTVDALIPKAAVIETNRALLTPSPTGASALPASASPSPAPAPPAAEAPLAADLAEGAEPAQPRSSPLADTPDLHRPAGAPPPDFQRNATIPRPAEAGARTKLPDPAAEPEPPAGPGAAPRTVATADTSPADAGGADPALPAPTSAPAASSAPATPGLPGLQPPAAGAPPTLMATAPPPAFAPPTLPPGLPGDLAAVLHAQPDGPVELRLSPEELGRLHVLLAGDGDTLRVTIFVERPETLDLLRRHADLLVHEIRAAGFAGGAFTFAGWGSGGLPGQPGPDPRATQPDPSDSGYAPSPVSDRAAPPAAATGLHLRL